MESIYAAEMPPRHIFHICPESDWNDAVEAGFYCGGELDRQDGFIHFSGPEQVRETAERYLAGVTGLVLLKIEAERLGHALRWEKSRNDTAFPHLYGPLPVTDVERVTGLPLGSDGLHVFPEHD